MSFAPTGGNPGPCSRGGDHDSTGSFDFFLPHDISVVAGTQGGWRFCRKCSVLFFGGNPGSCVRGGGHDGTGSFNFVLAHGSRFIPTSHKIDEGTDLVPVSD